MAKKFPILIADRISVESLAYLKEQEDCEIMQCSLGEAPLESIEALMIRSQVCVDQTLLAKMPRLKVIVTATSGFDHIDLQATAEHHIAVMYCPKANAQSAAELTWALILATQKRLFPARKQIVGGEWNRAALLSEELAGKTLGIIGLGQVGSRVARMALGFDMKLMIHDPYQEDMFFTKLNVERRGFEEVLCSSDILTLHVPLTRRTRHILNKTTLELMPSGTTVINVSRGQVVCEDSLYGALMSGQIWAAGLDVYEKEPVAKSARLLTLPQVVTTPHIGANTFEAFRRASEHAVEKILVFLRSGESSDLLPPTSAWWTEDNA